VDLTIKDHPMLELPLDKPITGVYQAGSWYTIYPPFYKTFSEVLNDASFQRPQHWKRELDRPAAPTPVEP
jgi:hypothetical protein